MSLHRRAAARPTGFFVRHLAGGYSLGRSYWVHTVLLGWGVMALGVWVLQYVGERYAMRHVALGLLVLQVLVLLVWVWSLVGCWMSAMRHFFGPGRKLWAVLAVLSLSAGAFGTIKELLHMRLFFEENWAQALGEQPTDGFRVTLAADGRVVDFEGGVNEGAAVELDKVVAAAPKVTTVRLHSPGGWLKEGTRMAEVVRRYGLSTRVDDECHSACTLVFLAGVDRTAGPHGIVGFHRGRSAGEAKEGVADGYQAKLYLQAGLSPAFVQRILTTPHNGIWMPSHRELLQAGVLTR